MNYCKENFRNVWIVIDDPKYKGEKCPCCGRKFSKAKNKYLIVSGFFNKIKTDGYRIDYIAEYINPTTGGYEETIISYYYVDFKEDECGELKMDLETIKKLEKHSIFDLSCSKDDGSKAFKTKKEAKKYIEEFGVD